jgi:hypothetical protein
MLLVVVLAILLTVLPTACASLKQVIAVPSYWYPCTGGSTCDWDRVDVSSPPADIAIINPDSGPGASFNAAYLAQTQRSQAAGIRILGYVHTSYGNRSMTVVLQEIQSYIQWYKVDGIFVDEASSDCTTIPYYSNVTAAIRSSIVNSTVMLNPGDASAACYLNVSDIIVTFEGSYDSYTSYKPASWHMTNAASRFWHIIYAANETTQQHYQAVELSKTFNAGWVYVTNLTLPNPYSGLPGLLYFDDVIRWASNEF